MHKNHKINVNRLDLDPDFVQSQLQIPMKFAQILHKKYFDIYN